MPRSNECFQQWLDAWKAGDLRGRDRLLEWSQRRLKSLAHRLVRPTDRVRRFVDSDDVLQEALLKLVRTLDRPPDTIAAFFFHTGELIRRTLFDFARKYYGPRGDGKRTVSNVGALSGSRDALAGFTDSDLSPCSQAVQDESRRALAEALTALPPQDRELVDLLYVHGLSQVDAGRMLGITDRTVRSRWARIGCTLGTALAAMEIEQ